MSRLNNSPEDSSQMDDAALLVSRDQGGLSNEEAFLAQVNSARDNVASAQKEYDARVAKAKRALKDAEDKYDSQVKRARKEYEERIKAAESKLKELEKAHGEKINSFAGITLCKNRVYAGRTEIPLLTSPTVSIEQTLTNKDETCVLIKINAKGYQSISAQCALEKAGLAREFVDFLRAQIASAPVLEQQFQVERTNILEQIQNEKDDTAALEQAKRNTAEVESAKQKLKKETANKANIENAQACLNAITKNANEAERRALASHDKEVARKKCKVRLIIAGVIVVVLIVVAVVLASKLGS